MLHLAYDQGGAAGGEADKIVATGQPENKITGLHLAGKRHRVANCLARCKS